MPFESPAIVELMGHAKIAGKVSEQVIAGVAMLRVDVPKTSKREGYTKFYSANAVYCITPTDEATADKAAEAFDIEPISPWVLRLPESPMLAEKTRVYDPDYDDPYDGYPDDEDDDYGYSDDDDDSDMPVSLNALKDIKEIAADVVLEQQLKPHMPTETDDDAIMAGLEAEADKAKDAETAGETKVGNPPTDNSDIPF